MLFIKCLVVLSSSCLSQAFTAALQTQWSWILQLCCCVESHLKENTLYFHFFSDLKEAEEKMKKMEETMRRKYRCDRSMTVTRLEDLLQDQAVGFRHAPVSPCLPDNCFHCAGFS